jgi:hypothetical protein
MERGVIASAQIVKALKDGFSIERRISAEEVRYYAMYWDRVVLPTNNIVHVVLDNEDELIDCGVVERPAGIFSGHSSQMPALYLDLQAKIANERMSNESDVDWVIHQIGDRLVLPEAYSDEKRSLKFELVNSLPVPSGDVSVADLLDFKLRRKDELNALHNAVDDLYLDILKSPDQNLSKTKALAGLRKSISDVSVVTKEKWALTSNYDLSVSFNLDGGALVAAASAGAVIDAFQSMYTGHFGLIAGPLISMVKIKAGYSASMKSSAEKQKLSYLGRAYQEGVIKR